MPSSPPRRPPPAPLFTLPLRTDRLTSGSTNDGPSSSSSSSSFAAQSASHFPLSPLSPPTPSYARPPPTPALGSTARYTALPTSSSSSDCDDGTDALDLIQQADEMLIRMSAGNPDVGREKGREKRETSVFLGSPQPGSSSSSSTQTAPGTPLTPLPPYSPPRLTSPSFASGDGRRGSFWALAGGAARKEKGRVGSVVVWVLVGGLVGWMFGRGGGGGVSRESVEEELRLKAPETIPGRCDPYSPSRPGHLLLHPTSYAANRWQALDDGLAPCEPTNWMDLVRRSGQRDLGGLTEEEWRSLEFLRGKSVAVFGDSVDRDQNEHFCEFVGGKFDMVHANDPLSPPYRPGEERPHGPGMHYQLDLEDGGDTWPDYGQSRPYICRVERLNFTTVSVFHYGFTPEEAWLRNSPHFYPPSALTSRFTSIVLPLLHSLFGDAGPSVFSFAPGFWDIMRQIKLDELEAQKLLGAGRFTPADEARLNAWSELSAERRRWFEETYARFLEEVLEAWGGEEAETRVVWRALHQPKPFGNAPKNRVAVVDAIGRGVVQRLINQDQRDALAASKAVKDSGKTPLSERLYVTNWGKMILGYEHTFRDDIHPNPMPSSWLAWNILLEQVKMTAVALIHGLEPATEGPAKRRRVEDGVREPRDDAHEGLPNEDNAPTAPPAASGASESSSSPPPAFPVETLLNIMSSPGLAPRDFAACALVSHTFLPLARTFLYRNVHLATHRVTFFGRDAPAEPRHFLSLDGDRQWTALERHIHLRDFVRQVSFTFTEEMRPFGPLNTRDRVDICFATDVPAMLSSLDNLKHIVWPTGFNTDDSLIFQNSWLLGVTSVNVPVYTPRIAYSLPHLTELNARACLTNDTQTHIPPPAHLKHLILSSDHKASELASIKWITSNSHDSLSTLFIPFDFWIPNADLFVDDESPTRPLVRPTLSHFASLHTLSLSAPSYIPKHAPSEPPFLPVWPPSLRDLSIYTHNTRLTDWLYDRSAGRIFPPTLRRLTLDRRVIQPIDLLQLLRDGVELPHLKRLDMSQAKTDWKCKLRRPIKEEREGQGEGAEESADEGAAGADLYTLRKVCDRRGIYLVL
ncbi:hypothetical protein JCM8097_001409 [Rhodosporidiobolus ruineniae]